MASVTIGPFSGTSRTMKLTVTEQSVDSVNNTSVVKWVAETLGDSTWYDSHLKVEVNGSKVYEKTVGWNDGFPAQQGSTSGTATISHNEDGKKSISFKITGYANVYSDLTASGTLALTNIDRTAPTVTQSVSAVSSTKLSLQATANVECDLWRYSLDNGAWTDFSSIAGTSVTGEITVTENTHSIRLAGRKKTNAVWGYGTTQNIDTRLPSVTAQISDIDTDSFVLSASSNYNCNLWQYSLNNGATWTIFSSTDETSASTTVTGLTVNTQYIILIRAKRTDNNLYSANISKTVKTQGGIAHIVVSNTFKDAIAYVKIGSALKQTICYTCVNGTWRIGI